jgi:hypothetical protein
VRLKIDEDKRSEIPSVARVQRFKTFLRRKRKKRIIVSKRMPPNTMPIIAPIEKDFLVLTLRGAPVVEALVLETGLEY